MAWWKDLLDFAGNMATNEVLKERLALAVDRGERIEEEKKALEEKAAQLEEQLRTALDQLHAARQRDEFVEHRGALFKRSGGAYVKAVYCPRCKVSVGSMEGVTPYYCQACRWMADFTGHQLAAIMAGLPK